MSKSKNVILSREDRIELLKGYNELKDSVSTLEECQDMWLSDLKNIRNFMCVLHKKLNFTSSDNQYYSDWVLEEDTEKGGNK